MKTFPSHSTFGVPPSGGIRKPFRLKAELRTLRLPCSRSLLLSLFLTLTFTFTFTATARAQWQSTTYTLHGGWNSIYLHGDASYATIDALLSARTEIVSVWRWNPNPNQIQVSASSLIPMNGTPEWSTWTRGGIVNTLTAFSGPAAYLVECTGGVTDTYSLPLVQKALPPRSTWVRNGANLLGFPTRLATNYPTLSAYFATFPAAIASDSRIYKYAGGPLDEANPIQVFSTATERLDRTQAYWFEAPVVSNFYAPLEVSPSNLDGLIYGRNGSLVTVRVRNRTSGTVNLTVAPVPSAAAPAGQDQITAAVPLTYRTSSTTTGAYNFTDVTTPIGVVVGPQASVDLTFGVARTQITGTPGTLYASLLRFTDAGNLMDVYLPVSARVTSLSGLWMGDVTVSNVQSNVAGSAGTTTAKPYSLRVLLHVDDSGTVRLLSHVFMGRLATAPNNLGLCTLESALKQDDKARARRFTAAHLPPGTVVATGTGSVASGQTLVRTVALAYTAPTNPFVHTYHPDHDNRNARFDGAVPAGVESPAISRQMSFGFTNTPPAGSTSGSQEWGSAVIGGTYSETVTGLHKNGLTATGTFELRRVSEIGSITIN